MSSKSKAEIELQLIGLHKDMALRQYPSDSAKTLSPIFENRVALSVSEAAYALGVSSRTIERIVRKGDLRVCRAGRRLLIPKNELEAWLNRRE